MVTMTRRAIGIGWVAALVLAASGCGGGNGDSEEAGESADSGGCAEAKEELVSTVSERDRLFVDLQLDKAAKACASELSPGSEQACTTARADLAAAAAEDTAPPNVPERVESSVEACIGVTIKSTVPPP